MDARSSPGEAVPALSRAWGRGFSSGVARARTGALATAAALVASGGLGCQEAPESPAFKERRQIRELVASYQRDRASGDGAAACAAYTPALRTAMERKGGGPGGCARAITASAAELTEGVEPDRRPQVLEELGDPNRVLVRLRGSRATAEYDVAPAGVTPPAVALERVGGQWRISAVRATPSPP